MPIFKFSLNDLSETHNIDVYISLYVKTIYNEISMRNACPLMRDSFMIFLLHKIDYKLSSDTHSQFGYKTTIMFERQQKIKGYGLRNCHPKSALKPAQQLLMFFFGISSLFRSMCQACKCSLKLWRSKIYSLLQHPTILSFKLCSITLLCIPNVVKLLCEEKHTHSTYLPTTNRMHCLFPNIKCTLNKSTCDLI